MKTGKRRKLRSRGVPGKEPIPNPSGSKANAAFKPSQNSPNKRTMFGMKRRCLLGCWFKKKGGKSQIKPPPAPEPRDERLGRAAGSFSLLGLVPPALLGWKVQICLHFQLGHSLKSFFLQNLGGKGHAFRINLESLMPLEFSF